MVDEAGAGQGADPILRDRTETWFIHQGLPHFIEGYSVTGDVLTRAVPFLTLVFVLEAFNTFSDERGGAGEIAPFFVGLAVLVGALLLVNRLHGRRAFQRPDKVGGIEIAVFLLVPPILPAVLHDDRLVDSAGIFVTNLVILLITYVVTSYGLLPMTRWGIRQLAGQLGDLANVMARALPLLLIFSTLLFLTTEIWQVSSSLGAPFFAITTLIPFVAGTLFLILRVPQELDRVAQFERWTAVRDLAEGTPVAELDLTGLAEPPETPRLRRRAWLNVGLVLVVSQGVQILLVSIVVGLFYVAFGLFAVSESVTAEWSVGELDVLAEFTLFGNEAVLTTELLQVAAFIAAFSGLQFTVSAITDETYRQEFFERAVRGVRQALAVRALYLVKLVGPSGPVTRVARRSLVGLVLLVGLVVAQQVWWAFDERPGLGVDIDEAGYLDRAVDAGQRLSARDPGSVVSLYLSEGYPEAPLLSAVTAPVLVVGEAELAWGLVAQAALFGLLLVATFFVGRRLAGDPWGLVAASVVAATPGFVDYARSYQFAVLSAAMLTTALWCLLASDRFARTWPAIGWGVFVGLALLSRTMMVSLVPGLVLAAAVAALAPSSDRLRRVLRLGVACVVAAAVALPWWVANWTVVSTYLTSYGYGGSGAEFGRLYSPTEPLYYLRIPYRMAQELYLPLAAVLLVGLGLAAWAAVMGWRRLGTAALVQRGIERGHLLLVIVLVTGIAALMSSRNKGTGFVLPLLPIVVVLAVVGFRQVRVKAVRWAVVGALGLVLVLDLVMKSGVVTLPGGEQVVTPAAAEGPIPVVDGRSRIEVYLGYGGYPPDADLSGVVSGFLDQIEEAAAGGAPPVIGVGSSDYLLNGNLVALVQEIEQRRGVVWTASAPPEPSVGGYVDLLETAAGNPPTTSLVTVESTGATIPGAADVPMIERAARRLGFTVTAAVPVGEGREARLWQRDVEP